MSSTSPSSSAPQTAAAAQTAARAGSSINRKPGQQDEAAYFANLMSLLSASIDTPAVSDALPVALVDPDKTPSEPVEAHGDATLAAMMQWAGLPQPGVAARTQTETQTASIRTPMTHGSEPAAASIALDAVNDPMLEGMTVLAQPEAFDPQALPTPPSALGEGVTGATSTPARTLNPAMALARHAGMAHTQQPASGTAVTPSLQQAHHDRNQGERLQMRVLNEIAVAARSTVMLDERFYSLAPPEGLTLGSANDVSSPLASVTTGQGNAAGLSHPSGDGADTGSQDTASDQPFADHSDAETEANEDWAQAQEDLDAYASPTSLRQASLRVGEDGADAIDIQLSLKGQELDLGFRTDDADARAALMRHAEDGLSELLRRGGIQLGDVSVGAQSGQANGGEARQPSGRNQPPATSRAQGTAAHAESPQSTPLPPRRDGSRPLDLFV
jgi:hypothetical protein